MYVKSTNAALNHGGDFLKCINFLATFIKEQTRRGEANGPG